MTTSSSDAIAYIAADGIATITMNRPDAMNALNAAMKEQLRDRVLQAAADDNVRAVVLTGSGRAFCAGQDLKEHAAMLDADPEPLGDTIHEHYNPTVRALLTMPKPVVAVVNGLAVGAGMSFACACDLRIAAESAGFNVAFASVGLSCDTGMSWTLPRLVGWAKARELLLSPRTIPSTEALQLGLVTEVVPDEDLPERGSELAATLAEGPTVAYAAIKSALAVSASATLDDALEHEGQMMMRAGNTSDHREAVTAFVEKRKPQFRGH